MVERLQKLMAYAGLGSRRANEAVIRAGRVRVNGRVAKLGDKADPEKDTITVDGKPIAAQRPIYVMVHKPRGVLSSTEDELDEDRPTVRELVPLPGHLYPVGRLDKPSEGLILLTNDGRLAHRLTHPRYEHEKVYEVEVEGRMADEALEEWRRGVMLDGKLTAPATIDVVQRGDDSTRLRVTLREGRKRQIRRIAAAFSHPVQRLMRTRIGPLALGDLEPGKWRHLTLAEVAVLKRTIQQKEAGRQRRRRDTERASSS
ncbi:MAG: pseudouridine synthase [Anaerolineae bacterium]|nr:pseudouridine synthase [Anaerolineae bacterium]